MNLQVNSFPVKNKDMVLKPPYTITKALHYAQSHYTGYTIKDVDNNCVDVLNILDLREYIKVCPIEFTNAKIGDYGHIEIDDLYNIEHLDCSNYDYFVDKIDINNGLLGLINIHNIIKPVDFYSYELDFITKEYRCRLTDTAVEYFNGISKLYINDIDNKISILRSNDFLQIPSPLCKIDDIPVTSCKGLFSNINVFTDLSTDGFNSYVAPDFSLVDLSYYSDINSLFEFSCFDILDVKNFNLRPKGEIQSIFEGVCCNLLDLTDCDFSKVTSLTSTFKSCDIKELKVKGIDLSNLRVKDSSIFYNSRISIADASLYETIHVSNFDDIQVNGGLFSNLICKELLNLDTLPTNNATQLPMLFADLKVEVLDVTKLKLNKLENFNQLFSKLYCNKFVFNAKVFDQAKTARSLFENSLVSSGLNLKQITFKNLELDGAVGMFKDFEVNGEFNLPKSYGLAQNFDCLFKGLKARKIQMKHSDFSKAISMCSFFEDAQIYQNVSMPKKDKLVPKNLVSAANMLALGIATSLDIRGWDFDKVPNNYSNLIMKNNKTGLTSLDADFNSNFVQYLISNNQYKKVFRAVRKDNSIEFYKSTINIKPRISWTKPINADFTFRSVVLEIDLNGYKLI